MLMTGSHEPGMCCITFVFSSTSVAHITNAALGISALETTIQALHRNFNKKVDEMLDVLGKGGALQHR